MADFHAVFANALRSGDAAGLAGFVDGTAETKFAVYRNNVVKGAADTLGDAYPAVKRLVGDQFFQGMARAFWADHPPQERTLTLYGEAFADFVEQFEPARPLIYLADVARLDRAWLEAHHAPDAKPLQLAAVQNLPPEKLARIAPGLHPSVRVNASDLPAFSIWKTNRVDETVARISLESRGETALIHRPAMEVIYRRLSPAEQVFLNVIAASGTFEMAASAIADQFPGAEPAPVFITLLKQGVFNGLD